LPPPAEGEGPTDGGGPTESGSRSGPDSGTSAAEADTRSGEPEQTAPDQGRPGETRDEAPGQIPRDEDGLSATSAASARHGAVCPPDAPPGSGPGSRRSTGREDDEAGIRKASLSAVLAARAGDLPRDPFVRVAERLAAGAAPGGEGELPLAEAYTGHREAGRQLLHQVEAESARLRARLQGLVQASRMDRPRAVRSGRRLDPRRLYRTRVMDDRIFARKSPRAAPNTAVHLLVDLSGSMRDAVTRANGEPTSRGRLALEAALALALALAEIPGVTVAASAFPGLTGRDDRVVRMLPYGAAVRARAGAFVQAPRGGTPLTGALWHAAAELLARTEERRVALVLTDGVPNDVATAKRLIARCRTSGLEVVGVGIQVDVSHLFEVAVEVREVTDLKRALFGVAERLLLAA